MKNLKSHFDFNKKERNGIFFLAVIILCLQLIYFYVDFSYNESLPSNKEEIARLQLKIDSAQIVSEDSEITQPFNPNFITDYKGYLLGMSAQEIDRLLSFRKSGKFVNSPEEFQKITKVSDSLLHALEPLFKFPDFVKRQSKSQTIVKDLSIEEKGDLNHITKSELMKFNGIGEKLAERILAYRQLLNGFYFEDQLYEVYYLNKEIADEVLKVYAVKSKPVIKKLNINEATFKEILDLPYIDYSLTKKIFQHKDRFLRFESLEELQKIDSFPLDKFDRIALYLEAN
ncbi:ComEA family DNA-binding protein [Namhaeicola litoreus]|uniref:ComEA family DNA-binding protein n=1 Tax=Namhaeicola litoreus TaxID=1052145 RepID=A0ABW3Y1N3_9FLAO